MLLAVDLISVGVFAGWSDRCAGAERLGKRVLDPFHVVKLGLSCLDDVRRRVQHDTTGHRGRTGDPLYGIRRVLRRRRDRLSVKARAWLEAGLIVGDPTGETTLAWTVAHDLMVLPAHRPRPSLHPRHRADHQTPHLPDPRDRQVRPHPARLAHRIGRPLRPPQHYQRAHRKPQPQNQKHQAWPTGSDLRSSHRMAITRSVK
jgi:transposase